MQKLQARLEAAEREKTIAIEQMNSLGAGTPVSGQESSGTEADRAMIAKMAAKIEELEAEKVKLSQELGQTRSSLEEVYKALVQ